MNEQFVGMDCSHGALWPICFKRESGHEHRYRHKHGRQRRQHRQMHKQKQKQERKQEHRKSASGIGTFFFNFYVMLLIRFRDNRGVVVASISVEAGTRTQSGLLMITIDMCGEQLKNCVAMPSPMLATDIRLIAQSGQIQR